MELGASRRPDDDQRGEEVIAAGAPTGKLRWALTTVERVAETDSTNRVAADAARAGAGEGYVVIADSQTAGRGRLGRSWTAPPGSSLLCSLVFRAQLPDDLLHLPAMLVALAAKDACAGAAAVEVSLKWPNDLVVTAPSGGWRKVGGVLAEVVPASAPALGGAAPERAVVVGIGVNLNWSEADIHALGTPASALNLLAAAAATGATVEAGAGSTGATAGEDATDGATGATAEAGAAGEAGATVDREQLLGALLEGVGGRRHLLERSAGRRVLLDEYRSNCSTIGRRVRVELLRDIFEGTAVGVDGCGRLLVETAPFPGLAGGGGVAGGLPEGSVASAPGSLRAVAFGDVVHLR